MANKKPVVLEEDLPFPTTTKDFIGRAARRNPSTRYVRFVAEWHRDTKRRQTDAAR